MTLIDFYSTRTVAQRARASKLGAQYNRLALVRLGLFLLAMGSLVWVWSIHPMYTVGGLGLFIVFFFRLVQRHRQIQEAQQHSLWLARVNTEEAAAVGYDFSAFGNGSVFQDVMHPYSGDLDLFGSKSIFQALNRCTTHAGATQLAAFLTHPATVETVLQRQQAVRVLAGLVEWRQDFRAYGLAANVGTQDMNQLHQWLQVPALFPAPRFMSIILGILPIVTTAAVGFTVYQQYSWVVSVACVLPSAYLLRRYGKAVNQIHQQTTQTGALLKTYSRLIAHIEQHPFDAALLNSLQQKIQTTQVPASKALRQLAYFIHQLEARNNPFIIFFNLLGLWELQWVYRLERWKQQWKPALSAWFDTVAEFEALASLANLHYNEPEWVFPVLHTEGVLNGVEVGHPLIPSSRRVGNDIAMPVRGHLKLITGSNMAGKSTFLRTVGVNIVLAQCGAPVCAKAFELPPLRVFTSMRTQDALSENASSFYAELRRLQALIECVRDSQDASVGVFFLLDEILKGTNSRDRYQGAAALIRQLIRLRGAGMIATHDLELTALEAESNGQIENLCIDVRLQDNQLVFDYKLKRGSSQTFNATQLMRDMGIDV